MKRLYLILASMLALTLTAGAQTRQPVKPVPSDESQLTLKSMQKKWMALQSSKITFTLQSEKEGKTLSTLKGNIWTKGNCYKLVIPEQTIVCDGKSVWNYLPQNKEVSINPYEEEEQDLSLNPIKVIQTYDKYYRSALIRETAEKGIAVQIIDLYPLKGQSFYKIRLVVRKDKMIPIRASIHEKNGTVDTYYFDQILFNPSLGEDFFRFDTAQYPGVEVIDMR